MLAPGERTLYTDALVPPPGFQLDLAVAATFSLDLTTLLSVPLQLVLHSTEDHHELLKDPVTLYEALQRAASRVQVFVQRGAIHAPPNDHLLFALLENMLVEVEAPNGGVFHPKAWVLRFAEEDTDDTLYRLMLPSKNLTTDRAWDTALTLDGRLGESRNGANAALVDLVRRLPDLAVARADTPRASVDALADELERVEWELPEGFDALRFHSLGLGGARWHPPPNDHLVVISPFVRAKALQMLGATSRKPAAIVSRSDQLSELGEFEPFAQAYVLHDAAETEDGEDADTQSVEVGLHAKVYVFEAGKRTHLVLGSANATNAALLAGRNVELLAELAGPRRRAGRVRELLDPGHEGGLGALLVPWRHESADEVNAERRAIEQRLEKARTVLLAAEPALCCKKDGDGWLLELSATRAVDWSGIDSTRAWPVTVGRERAVDLAALAAGGTVALPVQAAASLTGLIAFELATGSERLAFVLHLPVDDMPEERERAILRHVVNNREGFLRYLLLLLAGLGDGADVGSVARAFGGFNAGGFTSSTDDLPLLEEMVRAFSRDPKRLEKVRQLVEDITADGGTANVLPEGFFEFWNIFREPLDGETL
jgi:hypothetical protein